MKQPAIDAETLGKLERRLGRVHARQRLGIESDHEAQIFGQGIAFFHIENWYSVHSVIRATLKLAGIYRRGRKNTERIRVRRNPIASPDLPKEFDGFTILHITDMHVDMNAGAMRRLVELVRDLAYDICVLTGDFRGKTFGSVEPTLAGLRQIRPHLKGPVYGVLGNHDSIRMVPAMEEMGIRMLLNESETITRPSAGGSANGAARIHLAGIDDAHFYQVDNIEKAASAIPHDEFSILLSHTPEVYRHAAHADFNVMLSGHTHGGQICLPGSIPITIDAAMPRHFASGAWTYHKMAGYTSVGVGSCVVPVRYNCPPEITLHILRSTKPAH